MKDKKEYDYYDNLGRRYKTSFIGGLLWAVTFGVIYGVYKGIEWLIS